MNRSLTFPWDTASIRGIAVTAWLLVALASVSHATAGETRLFPLGARSTWVLSDEAGGPLTIRATRTGGSFVLRGFPGFATLRVRPVGGDVQAWNARGARWAPFLRLSAPVGTRYRVDLPASPLWRRIDVTVTSRATCYVASRPVRGCVTLDLRALQPVADAGVERLVFAPGIGPVEIVVQTIAGPRTYSLGRTGPPLG